jgi:hypothetical protein
MKAHETLTGSGLEKMLTAVWPPNLPLRTLTKICNDPGFDIVPDLAKNIHLFFIGTLKFGRILKT